jgi:L-2-hydroxyglutarate oxidase LhgO
MKIVIIGGGIVGLATAYQYVQRYPGESVTILEKETQVAFHQTGHNSGVIHSGIYYKPGSLKAQNCRRGINLLLDFCNRYEIPYELCGKVIVATRTEELPTLEMLFERGQANGVKGLQFIGPERLYELEPHAAGIRAVHCPTTGIIDFQSVAEKLQELILTKGGEVLLGVKVVGLKERASELIVETNQGDFNGDQVINCAGLFSDRISDLAGVPREVRIIPFRGEYYVLREGKRWVRNLIYPVPNPQMPFLGVHFTRRLDGTVEAGPNAVLALAREGYHKRDIRLKDMWDNLTYGSFWSMARRYWKTAVGEYYRSYSKQAFVRALQQLVPAITADDVEPGGSGVRAQALARKGQLVDDFVIRRKGNMIHVLNTPSPAATSSLAIGATIVKELQS